MFKMPFRTRSDEYFLLLKITYVCITLIQHSGGFTFPLFLLPLRKPFNMLSKFEKVLLFDLLYSLLFDLLYSVTSTLLVSLFIILSAFCHFILLGYLFFIDIISNNFCPLSNYLLLECIVLSHNNGYVLSHSSLYNNEVNDLLK